MLIKKHNSVRLLLSVVFYFLLNINLAANICINLPIKNITTDTLSINVKGILFSEENKAIFASGECDINEMLSSETGNTELSDIIIAEKKSSEIPLNFSELPAEHELLAAYIVSVNKKNTSKLMYEFKCVVRSDSDKEKIDTDDFYLEIIDAEGKNIKTIPFHVDDLQLSHIVNLSRKNYIVREQKKYNKKYFPVSRQPSASDEDCINSTEEEDGLEGICSKKECCYITAAIIAGLAGTAATMGLSYWIGKCICQLVSEDKNAEELN